MLMALTGIEGANHGLEKPWQNYLQIPDVVTRLSLVDLGIYRGDSPFFLAPQPRKARRKRKLRRFLPAFIGQQPSAQPS
jgi:hypothetical protein